MTSRWCQVTQRAEVYEWARVMKTRSLRFTHTAKWAGVVYNHAQCTSTCTVGACLQSSCSTGYRPRLQSPDTLTAPINRIEPCRRGCLTLRYCTLQRRNARRNCLLCTTLALDDALMDKSDHLHQAALGSNLGAHASPSRVILGNDVAGRSVACQTHAHYVMLAQPFHTPVHRAHSRLVWYTAHAQNTLQYTSSPPRAKLDVEECWNRALWSLSNVDLLAMHITLQILHTIIRLLRTHLDLLQRHAHSHSRPVKQKIWCFE